MIVDTSALVAIVRNEADKPIFLECLTRAAAAGEAIRISAGTLIELFIVIDRYKDEPASRLLDTLLAELNLEISPVEPELTTIARAANRRFGKGNHPAKLNFGDCFAYALAKQTGEPLLFKGDDFARTDIVSAV